MRTPLKTTESLAVTGGTTWVAPSHTRPEFDRNDFVSIDAPLSAPYGATWCGEWFIHPITVILARL
ncbi:MAG: hypothetical protein AB1830_12990 [Pseudomonadota bacterium]